MNNQKVARLNPHRRQDDDVRRANELRDLREAQLGMRPNKNNKKEEDWRVFWLCVCFIAIGFFSAVGYVWVSDANKNNARIQESLDRQIDRLSSQLARVSGVAKMAEGKADRLMTLKNTPAQSPKNDEVLGEVEALSIKVSQLKDKVAYNLRAIEQVAQAVAKTRVSTTIPRKTIPSADSSAKAPRQVLPTEANNSGIRILNQYKVVALSSTAVKVENKLTGNAFVLKPNRYYDQIGFIDKIDPSKGNVYGRDSKSKWMIRGR